ncbi:hypothetical protein H0H81_002120 [Sphagnurus paluster]|uniref:Uncharacterized protein n=1 Tax=Sphagnurus paluster TaxID=117069 RepID=A0A9P7K2Q7_9AGAR|nr:hypothetical protein H0H81_002120 [Sphagnurus paluster]
MDLDAVPTAKIKQSHSDQANLYQSHQQIIQPDYGSIPSTTRSPQPTIIPHPAPDLPVAVTDTPGLDPDMSSDDPIVYLISHGPEESSSSEINEDIDIVPKDHFEPSNADQDSPYFHNAPPDQPISQLEKGSRSETTPSRHNLINHPDPQDHEEVTVIWSPGLDADMSSDIQTPQFVGNALLIQPDDGSSLGTAQSQHNIIPNPDSSDRQVGVVDTLALDPDMSSHVEILNEITHGLNES